MENEEKTASSPGERAEAVKKMLGEKASSAITYFHDSGCVRIQLGDRILDFTPEENQGGRIEYGDTNWRVHCYGSFAPDELQAAANYLLDVDSPPPSIQEAIDEIKAGLTRNGVNLEAISVAFPDGKRKDCPVIRTNSSGDREIKFGLYSPGTINAASRRGNGSLVDCDGAVRHLLDN